MKSILLLLTMAMLLGACTDQYEATPVSPSNQSQNDDHPSGPTSGIVYRDFQHAIWTIDADGTNKHEVVPGSENAIYFSTGRGRLVYMAEHSNGLGLKITAVNLDGSSSATLRVGINDSTGSSRVEGVCAISPDGMKVAYFTKGLATSDPGASEDIYSYYLHIVDSFDPTRSHVIVGVNYLIVGSSVGFTADGSRVIFEADGPRTLVSVNADGTNLTNYNQIDMSGNRQCAWTPDGNRFATADYVSGQFDVYDLSTGSSMSLPFTKVRVSSLGWAPDGSKILFGTEPWDGQNVTHEAHISDMSGNLITLALNGLMTDGQWAPDGSKALFITYESGTGGGQPLNVMDDTGRALTRAATDAAEAHWIP